MKICVMQGTFNPIHNAHIELAKYVQEKYDFDEIIFIPAYNPPHKEIELAEHRLKMTEIATEGYPCFKVSEIEYKRGGISYTYLTILELYKIHKPEGKINFIIGTDAFKNIETWYKAEELKNLLKFLVFPREYAFSAEEIYNLKNKGYDFEMMKHPYMDISSTNLRKIIKDKKDTTGLLNDKVRKYIDKYGLYSI